ncbi:hypothetical protein ABW21_db0205981 [Orbilia brochopaga]|nr:hypothetical protein ABW21_db0205981 [Drechslerella brochopaga]
MLKITIFGTLIVSAAALRSYGERYIVYIKQPTACDTDGGCPSSTSYEPCGSGLCTSGACGNWIKGYNNYCCTYVHGATLTPNCTDAVLQPLLRSFDFDSSGTPAEEGDISCPPQTGFIGEGIKNPKGDTCCHLDKDAVILYQNGTFSVDTEGMPTKARCVDPIVPIAAAKSSSSAPSPTSNSGGSSRPQSTGAGGAASTGTPSTTSTGSTTSGSPNAAPQNRLALAVGALPIFGLRLGATACQALMILDD